jgi:hypothetical protein
MDQEPKAGGSGSTDGASAGEPKTLQEFLSLPENKEANMVVPLTWCPHLETTVTSQVPEKVDIKSPCKECKHVGENWICLKVRSSKHICRRSKIKLWCLLVYQTYRTQCVYAVFSTLSGSGIHQHLSGVHLCRCEFSTLVLPSLSNSSLFPLLSSLLSGALTIYSHQMFASAQ